MARKPAAWGRGVGEQQVVVNVSCPAGAVIADSCVECAAIDRVAYNFLNDAARYADRPRIALWLVLFGSFTTSDYVGAKVVEDGFVGWFHWPLSGA